jgi:succinate dehydrogenase/fumarate reductase iron-sulfur protein
MTTEKKWNVIFKVRRQRKDQDPYFEEFPLEVDPDEYVLDGIERIWAFHDRSLTFRHACHHSTCGACGMRVNGTEKLTCITTIRSVCKNGGVIQVEPLRNFPVQSDLVVDMSVFYRNLEKTCVDQVTDLKSADLPFEWRDTAYPAENLERLVDCIECGLCISACPAAATSQTYFGPGGLAAAHQTVIHASEISLLEMAKKKDNSTMQDFTDPFLSIKNSYDLVDNQDGVWRCHSAFECTEVCPSNVDPAWRIMDMRKRIISSRIKNFLGIKNHNEVRQ